MRHLNTLGDLGAPLPPTFARVWAHHPVMRTGRGKFGSDRVRGVGWMGAGTDAGGTAAPTAVILSADLTWAAQQLLTYMQTSGVPYEYTADAKVQTFQADYVNAGNILPATQHAANGVDGLYGPETAAALAATLSTNVPPPNPAPSPAPAPSPSPSPSPTPSPSTKSSSTWVWVAIVVAGAVVGYMKRRRGAMRVANPCRRMVVCTR